MAEGASFRKISSQEYKDDLFLDRRSSSCSNSAAHEPKDGLAGSPCKESSSGGLLISELASTGADVVKDGDNQKQNIGVSFSADVKSDIDSVHESKPVLRSPSPPAISSSQTSSSLDEADKPDSFTNEQEKNADNSVALKNNSKEVYQTSMGRISIDIEGEELVAAASLHCTGESVIGLSTITHIKLQGNNRKNSLLYI